MEVNRRLNDWALEIADLVLESAKDPLYNARKILEAYMLFNKRFY